MDSIDGSRYPLGMIIMPTKNRLAMLVATTALCLPQVVGAASPSTQWQSPAFPSALTAKGPKVDAKALKAAAKNTTFQGAAGNALKTERDRKATIAAKRKAWCGPLKTAAKMPKPLFALMNTACTAAIARTNAASERHLAFRASHALFGRATGLPGLDNVAIAKAFLTAFRDFSSDPLYQDARAAAAAWAKGKPYTVATSRDAAEQACDQADGLACVVAGVMLEDTQDVRRAHANQAMKRYQQGCTIGEDLSCLHQALFTLRGPTKDDAKVRQLLNSACERKHGPSCHHLGLLHRFGVGATRSFETAKGFIAKGCRYGDPEACASWALTYLRSRRPDTATAKGLFHQACDQGSARGCAGLAFMTEFGLGTKKSASVALKGYLKSCAAGWGVACDNAAKMYTEGTGTRVNATKAFEYSARGCMLGWGMSCSKVGNALAAGSKPLTKPNPGLAFLLQEHACDDGHGSACVALGRAYEQGLGTRPNHPKAMGLYQAACDGTSEGFSRYKRALTPEGKALPTAMAMAKLVAKSAVKPADGKGCVELARIYNEGSGVRRDPVKAMAVIELACNRGVGAACRQWGDYHRQGNTGTVDTKAAVAAYERGCQLKDWASCAKLGFLHRIGQGVPKDGAKAVPFLSRACDNRYAPACAQMGTIYMTGNGVTKEPKKGMALYNRACSGGDALACANLGFNHLAGVGAKKSERTALRFFEKGCKLNNRLSCAQRDALKTKK